MNRRYLLLLILMTPLALAANDPGHDLLYIEEDGNSTLNGTINVTETAKATAVDISEKLFGDKLTVRANGTINTPSSNPQIQATGNTLYIDGTSDVQINSKGGTSGTVQVGETSTDNINFITAGTLNVTTNALVNNNITVNGSTVCTPQNGLCGTSGSNVSGSGSADQIAYWSDSSTITGESNLYWDSTDDELGIGVNPPDEALEVAGNINVTSGNDVCIEGGNCLSNAGSGSVAGSDTQIQFNDGGSFGADANFTYNKTSDRLGIGAGSPSSNLGVNGTMNVTTKNSTGIEVKGNGDVVITVG